jgi:hypothetical protein
MYKTKEEIAREKIYNTYNDLIKNEDYRHNEWFIRHYKKYIKIHSILFFSSIIFILINLIISFNTIAFIIWCFNFTFNGILIIKYYKLLKKEQLNTIELDKRYYPKKYLKSLRIKKFKKLNIKN